LSFFFLFFLGDEPDRTEKIIKELIPAQSPKEKIKKKELPLSLCLWTWPDYFLFLFLLARSNTKNKAAGASRTLSSLGHT
jgi:hypothetical protein